MRNGEAPASELEVAIFASLVLLDFRGDVRAKTAWLEHVRTHAKPFCRANEEPWRRVASALRAYDAELCELVSKAMPFETPIAGGRVMRTCRTTGARPCGLQRPRMDSAAARITWSGAGNAVSIVSPRTLPSLARAWRPTWGRKRLR